MERVVGFAPVYDEESVLLILGSFPSVKSRQTDFYYGNKQNRFWKTICTFFKEELPVDNRGKRELLKRRKIALWDVVTSCLIQGSADDSIAEYEVADIPSLLQKTGIKYVFLNGKKALEVFEKSFPALKVNYVLLPSTSPANPRYSYQKWEEALRGVFGVSK